MQYLKFGDLTLTALDGVKGFEEQSGYTFATQSIATGKPILQAMGETLSEISLNIGLRQALGHDIPDMLSRINALRKSGTPQRLIFSSGTYQGDYVISGISTSILNTSATGAILAADLSISLMEYADRVIISQSNTETKPDSAKSNRKVTEK